MRWLLGFVLLLLALGTLRVVGCGGEESVVASVNQLCREWCTCSSNANPTCLDSCEAQLLEQPLCTRNELSRYWSCMIERSCDDPFDDCQWNLTPQNIQDCRAALVADCEAQCGGRITKCENSVTTCFTACVYGVSCDRVVACDAAGCLGTLDPNRYRCWTTRECNAPQ